jgi:hypothetical protein
MIKITAYILNLFAPVVNWLGLFGLGYMMEEENLQMFGVWGVFALLGLIFGLRAYKLDIPPRWFWSKSKNDLFRFSVAAVLGYAVSIAMWPSAIYFVTSFLGDIISNMNV